MLHETSEPQALGDPKPSLAPKRMLDLFCGTGSVGRVYRDMGFEVVSVDSDPKWGADYSVDVLHWDYKKILKPGQFHTVVVGLPCTEFSRALTTRKRNLRLADGLARRALAIVRYLQPERWWLENPRFGLLSHRPYMKGIPSIDVDYCQYAEWGYRKPTRIWGSPDILQVQGRLCDGKSCKNLEPGTGRHRIQLSSPHQNLPRHMKYRIPEALIRDLARFPPVGDSASEAMSPGAGLEAKTVSLPPRLTVGYPGGASTKSGTLAKTASSC